MIAHLVEVSQDKWDTAWFSLIIALGAFLSAMIDLHSYRDAKQKLREMKVLRVVSTVRKAQ